MLLHIEENYSNFLATMYSVYKASNLSFPNEPELEKAKAFSSKILHKGLPQNNALNGATTLDDLQKEVIYSN